MQPWRWEINKIFILANVNSGYNESLKVCVFRNCTLESFSNGLFGAKYYYILLVRSGLLSMQINGATKQLTGHELIVIPIKSNCKVLSVLNRSQVYLVHFTSEFAYKNSIRKSHIGYFEFFITRFPQIISLQGKEMVFMIKLFKYLQYKSKNSELQFHQEIVLFSFNLLLYEIAGVYFKNHEDRGRIRQNGKEKFVIRFFRLLERHFRKEHQVKFYANALFVTVGYLTRTVKEVTGKTAKQFIDETIVLEAKILLQDGSLTISDIIELLHFSDFSFFGKFFKKHTSMSPTEYRLNLNF